MKKYIICPLLGVLFFISLAGSGADFVNASDTVRIYAQDAGGVNDVAVIWDREGNKIHAQGQTHDDYVKWSKNVDVRVKKGEKLTHYSRFNSRHPNHSHEVTVYFLNNNKSRYDSKKFTYHLENYTIQQDGYVRFPKGVYAREYSYLDLNLITCSAWGQWQDRGCGQGTCSATQMYQTRTRDCGGSGTEEETRCVERSECNPLNISCSVSPNPAETDQQVNFSASASGGTGNYNYSWAEDCNGTGSNCYKSFSSPGTYTATVSVTSGSQSQSASCSVSVEQRCTSHDHRACYGGDVYWYDSCGNREEKYDDCEYNETCQNGVCVRDDDLYVTCEAYPDPAGIGEKVSFSASADGGSGYYYSYEWHGDCYNYHSSTCEKKFYSPGTYSATVTVRSGSESKTATCSMRVDDEEEDHLACYRDDVYRFDADGHRLNKYEDCGSDYCEDDGENYCYNGDVYEKVTCYEKGCSNGSCYSDTRTERELVESCSSEETCSNGKCIKEEECSSGPCCEDGFYQSDDTVCDVQTQTQYGCPWGTGCGADAGKRTKSRFKYCSGSSSQCSGDWSDWDWGSWQVSDYCTYTETCSSGSPSCQYNSSCVTPQQTYFQNYTKGCYDNDMYWFDSNGARQGKYRDCEDDNECTLDGCQNGACFNELKCDGSTCQMGSEDYCQECESCGDGSCNCEENNCSCFEDCLGLVVSLLAKNTEDQNRWQESVKIDAGEKVHFLMNITNSGSEDLDEVTVRAFLPPEIDYDNKLTIEGSSLSGNIEKGISIGFLPSNTTRTISFRGETLKDLNTSQEVEVIGEISVNDSSASDHAEIDIAVTGKPSTAAGLIFSSDFFKKWYFWLLILPIALAILFLVSKKIFSFSK